MTLIGKTHVMPGVTPRQIVAYRAALSRAMHGARARLLSERTEPDEAAIGALLFPAGPPDVFLSHALCTSDPALSLAIALERFGLKVFVDSCIWGNLHALAPEAALACPSSDMADALRRERAWRGSTGMYMVLAAVVQRMIDDCELLLFTDSTEQLGDDPAQPQDALSMPWGFSARHFGRYVARRARVRHWVVAGRSHADVCHTHVPTVRFNNPGNRHLLAWTKVRSVLAEADLLPQGTPRRGQTVLDGLYRELELSPFERQLLGWTGRDADGTGRPR
ncbi:hypothetical protein [Stenotrophomonas sp. 24(2023)]|uniref:hypothetical protein n=1 Tax=Stenotrophomonas sp. 24(2023) TaxID=3068324 RepID=UPI0027E1DAD5|nr:hypothetical protein [Stenotrophomonas sp. 24(2023)]WMJ70349.1 hypothetical protein Q9R17_04380 [Stenotrophomonas sp. 24(2023)]